LEDHESGRFHRDFDFGSTLYLLVFARPTFAVEVKR